MKIPAWGEGLRAVLYSLLLKMYMVMYVVKFSLETL